MEQALDALAEFERAALDRWRRRNPDSPWGPDGRAFTVEWNRTFRFEDRRFAWSDGTLLDGLRAGWNQSALLIRAGEARKRGQYNYLKVVLPHEFTLKATISGGDHGGVGIRLDLREEIDPNLTRDGFQHGMEAVPPHVEEIQRELAQGFSRALADHRADQRNAPAKARPTGRVSRLTPADVRTVLRETVNRCVSEGWLPDYEDTGRFKRPRSRSPLIPADGLEIAHYADLRGALYGQETAWRTARDLIESFTVKRLGRGEFAVTAEPAFGPLAGVPAQWLEDSLQLLFASCGLEPVGGGVSGSSGIFRVSGRAAVRDLPEPYGKWLQVREHAPRWDEQLDLEVRVKADVTSEPRSGDPVLTLECSTFAPSLLDRLALAVNRQFSTQAAPPRIATPEPLARLASRSQPPSVTRRKAEPAPSPRTRRTGTESGTEASTAKQLPQGSWTFDTRPGR